MSNNPGYSLKSDGTGGFAYGSDIQPAAQHVFSTSITYPTGSAVDKIKSLETYYFYMNQLGQDFGWDRPEDNGGQVPRKIGLIAQELALVEPSLVRVMDWLETDEDYYWVDYEALYVLCLDAINELNARAEAVKAQLGMAAETYPSAVVTTTVAASPSNHQLSVTPTVAPEGTSSVWTLTADNMPDGTVVGFKLFGTANISDITAAESVGLNTWSQESIDAELARAETEGYVGLSKYDPDVDGWGFGKFEFLNGQAQVTLNYVLDNEAEGDETIIMKLMPMDSNKKGVPELSATATLTDV